VSGIRIEALRKHYGAARGIEHLDLEVEEGEFFVLLGPSGCGKTTALRCIAGLEEPDAGTIRIGATTVVAPARGVFVPPNRRDLGMVFQSYALWPHMTVEQNVGYPLRARGWPRDRARAAIARALALVDLGGLGNRYPGELSGGQQQRVALARAVVAAPKLILFDEPLSNLDAQLRARLRQDLRRVHRETGHTAVYVTHDQVEALALADRVAVMREGRVEQLGRPDDIFLSPATRFVAEFVGYDNLFEATVEQSGTDGVRVALGGRCAPLSARSSARLAPGSPVHLAVRSNRIRLGKGAAADRRNSLDVRVLDAAYLGDSYQCTVQWPGGRPLLAQVPADLWKQEGAALMGGPAHAFFPQDELVALPAGDGGRQ